MIYFIGDPVDHIGIENSNIDFLLSYFKDKVEIGYDCETTGFDPYTDHILAYQFGDSKNQFVVDALYYPIKLVKSLLEDPTKEFLAHNFKFDGKFLYHAGIYPHHIWDTYLGECVLHKGDKTIRKSLEATVHRYFNYLLKKENRDKIFREGFTYRVIKYCAEDVQFLPDIKQSQWYRLDRQDLLNSISLENLFVKVLTYIEYSGIYIDAHMWMEKTLQDRMNLFESLHLLNKWIIDNNIEEFMESQLDLFSIEKRTTIKWSSPKQVVELFNKLGIDTKVPDEKTGEMKDSVESHVVEKQKDKSTLIPIYLNYKKFEKILSTYGESVIDKIHPKTGRIHTQFTQVMNTGRLSSGGKIGDKETINLQNIPRLPEIKDRVKGKIYERECFTCEEGNILINADYSGQEQVVFANWSLDKDILAFYEKDLGDMHSFVASKIYPYLKDVPLKTIKTKYKDERQKAKATGFAINYGGDGNTIASNLNISKEEGEEIYKAYFVAFPGVRDYFKKAEKQALKDGYILFNEISKSKCFVVNFEQYKSLEEKVSKPGFWEVYREEKSKDSLLYKRELKLLVSKYFKLKGNISRMALNFPIQGSSAEITKLACIYIFEHILKNNLVNIVKFSNVIHDEILLECPESLSDTIVKIVEECMIKAGNLYCKVVPLKTEVKICKFWNH
jgi:DNA polymerase-1